MAYFQREITVNVAAAAAWDALQDVGHLHTRLVRGFVVECQFDGQTRHVSFANGIAATERIVAINEDVMRVSWAAVGERLVHHNASAQVVPQSGSACRIVWVVDVLPDSMAKAIDAMVQAGLQAMKRTLESPSAA